MQVVLLLLVFVEVQSCDYQRLRRGIEVKCFGGDLTSLTLNQSIFILNIANSSVEHVREIAFENCTNLRELHLEDNKLNNASEIPFHLLKELTIVHLSRNKLTKLDKDLFQHNTYLYSLYLSGNELNVKPGDAILKSESLRELYVSDCGLQEIFPNTFSDLPNLEQLHLSGNNLKFVSPLAFNKTSLIYFTVDETSLHALPENICSSIYLINLITYDGIYTLKDSKLCGKGERTDSSVNENIKLTSSSEEITTEMGISERSTPPREAPDSNTLQNSKKETTTVSLDQREAEPGENLEPPKRDRGTNQSNQSEKVNNIFRSTIGKVEMYTIVAVSMFVGAVIQFCRKRRCSVLNRVSELHTRFVGTGPDPTLLI